MTPQSLVVATAVAAAVLVVAGAARARVVPPRRAAGSPSGTARWRTRWRRRAPITDRDMARWCEAAGRELRAGASLARAVEQASAAQPIAALRPVVDALRRGQPLSVAIERADVDEARPLAVVVPVLRACTELGGPAATPIERAAGTLHGRADADAERWAHSAQARLSAIVLTVLPVGVLGLLAAGEPSIRASLTTPAGLTCVVAGGALNALGWCWMRRVIGVAP